MKIIKRISNDGTKLVSLTPHSIMRTRKRFGVRNNRQAKNLLKNALKKGKVIGYLNKHPRSYVQEFEEMFLIVKNDTLLTVYDEAMFEENIKSGRMRIKLIGD